MTLPDLFVIGTAKGTASHEMMHAAEHAGGGGGGGRERRRRDTYFLVAQLEERVHRVLSRAGGMEGSWERRKGRLVTDSYRVTAK